MKILQPHKISTEILDLIYEAKQYLIIVSPYVNFSSWDRLASELKNAKKRGIRIDFFVRNEAENSKSWEQVENLGLTPRLVTNLHAKFYFNEKNGVISSMNLLSSSNSNSIEIGCKLESENELDELKKFVKEFIIPNEVKERPNETDLYLSKEKFIVILEEYLESDTNTETYISYRNGTFDINSCSNSFTLAIDKVGNKIEISGIITQKEANKFPTIRKKFFNSDFFEYQLLIGDKDFYNEISAISKIRFSNTYLDNLRINEKKSLITEISGFVKGLMGYLRVQLHNEHL